jgi:hypothetical protein
MNRIPDEVLEAVRKTVQPSGRYKRRVPVVVLEGHQLPVLRTVNGRTCAVVGKDTLCGNYYD